MQNTPVREFDRERLYPIAFACELVGWRSPRTWMRNAAVGRVMKPVKIGGIRVIPGWYLAELIGGKAA